MKPGRVVYLRINPRDCIACVDIMDKLDIDTTKMSFDTVVRTALSALIATVQDVGMIPKSEGFDFIEKVANRFPNSRTHQAQRLQFTKNEDHAMQLREALDQPLRQPVGKLTPPDTPDQARAKVLQKQFEFKFEHNPENWSAYDTKCMGWLGEVVEGTLSLRGYQVLTGEIKEESQVK